MENPETLKSDIARGLSAPDFRMVSSNGFGDHHNSYPHSMAWFKDHLYVGTTRACLAVRGRWRSEIRPDWLGQAWPVKIPKGLFDNDLRGQIWRYHPPTGKWSMVFISPLTIGIDGFEVPLSCGFRSMAVFQGINDSEPALYIPTWGSHQTPEAVMLKSTDGIHFEVVSEPGLGFPDQHKPRGVRAFTVFKDRIFSSPAVSRKRRDPNIAGSMVVVETSDPSGGRWRLANDANFGDPNNLTVFQMGVFNDHLYAGTINVQEGFQVWKTDAEGSAPYKWKKILTKGAYRGRLNQIAMTFCAFNDCLYVGTAIQEGGLDLDNRIGPAGVEIIRIHPDDSWDLVMGDSRQTPDGLKVPISGHGAGFDSPFAGYLWAMTEHEGWLYAATMDWLVALRYANVGEGCPDLLRSMLNARNLERLIMNYGGCDLWRTRDGMRWVPVTRNGFNNCYNYGIRNMISTPHGLFVGTANPYGPEVAVKRTAGWVYEYNPRSGLEIWMGVRNEKRGEAQGPDCKPVSTAQVCDKLVSETDKTCPVQDFDTLIEKNLEELYGGRGFRHLGFWRDDIRDIATACENLMDEMLAFVPQKTGSVADIGCGFGATTQYLTRSYNVKDITGITGSRQYLAHCRERVPAVNLLQRKLPYLKLPEASFDLAMYAKGIEQLGPRKQLLLEIFRSLKPGGQLVCFDIIYSAASSMPRTFGFADKEVRSPLQYQELLLAAGFCETRVMPVTNECLNGFTKYLARYFHLKSLVNETIETSLKTGVEKALGLHGAGIKECVLISAFKPEDPAQQQA